jgi:hypothetical protein
MLAGLDSSGGVIIVVIRAIKAEEGKAVEGERGTLAFGARC